MKLYLKEALIGSIHDVINEPALDISSKIETNMKMHVSIFLLLGCAIGVLGAAADLFIWDDNGNPVKIDLNPINITRKIAEADFPNLISFYLYTRSTPKNAEKLNIGDTEGLLQSHFDPLNPTVFVTHGWISSSTAQPCTSIRDAYLKHGDYNVILIDWSVLAITEYIWVSNEVPKMAQYISGMIDFLESEGMDLSQVTVVGHSVGGHIAGLASYYAKNKVNYVVSLDPAGPNFEHKGPGSRISTDDATYVEVIHATSLVGLNKQLGHVDFYPNGALVQGGCKGIFAESCSHSRVVDLFAESINSDGFVAHKCDNYINYFLGLCALNPVARMGGVTPDLSVRGTYYLNTNSESPYAKF